MRAALDGLYRWSGYAAGACLVAIFAMMMIMSVGRQFGLNVPAGDDFVSWLMAAMGFLGLAHTFKKGEIIRMGLVIENTHGVLRRVMEIFALLIGSAIVTYFAWHAGVMTYHSWKFNDLSNGVIAVPMWWPQLTYAIGTLVLLIALVDELIVSLSGGWPSYTKEPPKTREEILERAASGTL
jgi:TRAP-type C4-dicarboxylate transport system permease small subunit